MNKFNNKDEFTKAIIEIKDEAYRIAFCYLKNETDSMDAVCNGVEKAYRNLKGLKERSYFKTWFIRIVINECKMIIRKNNKIISLSDDCLDSEIKFSPNLTTEDKIDLESVLRSLKSSERSLIYMKYYMGYTLRDISIILGLPEGTVKTKIYNTLKIFKKELIEEV